MDMYFLTHLAPLYLPIFDVSWVRDKTPENGDIVRAVCWRIDVELAILVIADGRA